MQLANIVRERWKGVLFCLIIAIPATLLGKQIEVVGGPVFAILFGMVLALVFPKNRREPLAAGVTYTSKKVLQYAVILLGFGMNLSRFCPRAPSRCRLSWRRSRPRSSSPLCSAAL